MIAAAEARRHADNATEALVPKVIADFDTEIRAAAKRGKYQVTRFYTLNESQRKRITEILTQQGYKVFTQLGPVQTVFEVSW